MRGDAVECKLGIVLARTGRLSQLGQQAAFVTDRFVGNHRHVDRGGRRYPLKVEVRDSGSDPDQARRVTEDLIRREHVQLVLTLGGTTTLPAVVETCTRLATPCVSTVLPWQVYQRGPGVAGSPWSFHFCWGLDGIAAVFAEMWERLAAGCVVGCLWNDGAQGAALRDPECGFMPVVAGRGHRLVDPGGYRESAALFDRHVAEFSQRGADIVTSSATGGDLARFLRLAGERRFRPRLITCSRWLAYPFGAAVAGPAPVATAVAWTPGHPFRSSLDGCSSAELARAYEERTGRSWSHLLGLASALFEVAVHAYDTADDPTDRRALAGALAGTRLDTIVGPLDWTCGPTPQVATVPLVGGQWRTDETPRFVVVTNSGCPDVPLGGEIVWP